MTRYAGAAKVPASSVTIASFERWRPTKSTTSSKGTPSSTSKLRTALFEAELAEEGGVSPRVSPTVELGDAAAPGAAAPRRHGQANVPFRAVGGEHLAGSIGSRERHEGSLAPGQIASARLRATSSMSARVEE